MRHQPDFDVEGPLQREAWSARKWQSNRFSAPCARVLWSTQEFDEKDFQPALLPPTVREPLLSSRSCPKSVSLTSAGSLHAGGLHAATTKQPLHVPLVPRRLHPA